MQSVEEIYQQYIKPLPDSEKLRLITIIATDLIESEAEKSSQSNNQQPANQLKD